jgi:hypothetical protein
VYLQHVNLGFLPLPAEDDLKHMRHVSIRLTGSFQQMTR